MHLRKIVLDPSWYRSSSYSSLTDRCDTHFAGTLEERGICRQGRHPAAEQKKQKDSEATIATYDMPCGMAFVRSLAWLQYLPISPTYGKNSGDNTSDTAPEQHENEGHELNEVNVP